MTQGHPVSPLWSDAQTNRRILGAIQRDCGTGPHKLVFLALIYTLTPVDIQTMVESVMQSPPHVVEARRGPPQWPFVPSEAQKQLLFPRGFTEPGHPMAEAIMTQALEWCREHHAVTMTDEVFRAIVEQAEAV